MADAAAKWHFVARALMLGSLAALAGCNGANSAPPPVGKAALHQAALADLARLPYRPTPADCINENGGSITFAQDAQLLTPARRIAMIFGMHDNMKQGGPALAKDKCAEFYRLSAPRYAGTFAFVDRGYHCGGLCGEGATLALEYSSNRWQLVAIHDNWVA